MRKYINNLGITCLEADEGYMLKKGEHEYKKVFLGINDRAELYEEIKIENNAVKSDINKIKSDIIAMINSCSTIEEISNLEINIDSLIKKNK